MESRSYCYRCETVTRDVFLKVAVLEGGEFMIYSPCFDCEAMKIRIVRNDIESSENVVSPV